MPNVNRACFEQLGQQRVARNGGLALAGLLGAAALLYSSETPAA